MIAWEESPRQFKMSKQLDEGKFGEDLARKFLNDPIIKVNHGISHYDDVTQDKSYQDKSGADQILYFFRTTQLLYIFSRVDVWFYAEKLMRGGIHLDPGIRKPKMYSAENISERNGSTLFFANGLCVNAEQTYKALGAQKRVIKYQVENPDSDVPTFSFCPFKL